MPLVSAFPYDPLIDGRQSARAMMVRKGVQRMMSARQISVLPEMSLSSGRRADLVCLSRQGDLTIIEIKTSVADFTSDRKWPEYWQHCDCLYFATHEGVPRELFPEECGLIISDAYGAEIIRESSVQRLAPATRRAVTLRFAALAADRLMQAEWFANRSFSAEEERDFD